MDMSSALYALRNGQRVTRTGWNGKGMFLYLVPASEFVVNRAPLLGILGEGTKVRYREHIDMRAADGSYGVWTCAQNDLTAQDWEVVPDRQPDAEPEAGPA